MRSPASLQQQCRPQGNHDDGDDGDDFDYPARALRALGLLLADGAPTVGGGKTF